MNEHEHNAFLGKGWRWPIAVDARGSFATVDGADELEQAMYLILATTPGERPMRPEFGSRLQQYVFAPIDGDTASRMARDVREALVQWEPRIIVNDVMVGPSDADSAALLVDIAYTIRSTNDRRNLVFPFYVIPRHEAADRADQQTEEAS